jgi:hypothetical protein
LPNLHGTMGENLSATRKIEGGNSRSKYPMVSRGEQIRTRTVRSIFLAPAKLVMENGKHHVYFQSLHRLGHIRCAKTDFILQVKVNP